MKNEQTKSAQQLALLNASKLGAFEFNLQIYSMPKRNLLQRLIGRGHKS